MTGELARNSRYQADSAGVIVRTGCLVTGAFGRESCPIRCNKRDEDGDEGRNNRIGDVVRKPVREMPSLDVRQGDSCDKSRYPSSRGDGRVEWSSKTAYP